MKSIREIRKESKKYIQESRQEILWVSLLCYLPLIPISFFQQNTYSFLIIFVCILLHTMMSFSSMRSFLEKIRGGSFLKKDFLSFFWENKLFLCKAVLWYQLYLSLWSIAGILIIVIPLLFLSLKIFGDFFLRFPHIYSFSFLIYGILFWKLIHYFSVDALIVDHIPERPKEVFQMSKELARSNKLFIAQALFPMLLLYIFPVLLQLFLLSLYGNDIFLVWNWQKVLFFFFGLGLYLYLFPKIQFSIGIIYEEIRKKKIQEILAIEEKNCL